MAFIEDEETQKNGLVMVLFGFGNPKIPPPPIDVLFAFKATRFTTSLPVRVTSWHLCKPPSTSLPVLNTISDVSNFLDQHFRIRTRIHVGKVAQALRIYMKNIRLKCFYGRRIYKKVTFWNH